MMVHAQIETQLLVVHAASAAWTAQGRFPEEYVLHAECDRGPTPLKNVNTARHSGTPTNPPTPAANGHHQLTVLWLKAATKIICNALGL